MNLFKCPHCGKLPFSYLLYRPYSIPIPFKKNCDKCSNLIFFDFKTYFFSILLSIIFSILYVYPIVLFSDIIFNNNDFLLMVFLLGIGFLLWGCFYGLFIIPTLIGKKFGRRLYLPTKE